MIVGARETLRDRDQKRSRRHQPYKLMASEDGILMIRILTYSLAQTQTHTQTRSRAVHYNLFSIHPRCQFTPKTTCSPVRTVEFAMREPTHINTNTHTNYTQLWRTIYAMGFFEEDDETKKIIIKFDLNSWSLRICVGGDVAQFLSAAANDCK